MCIHVRAFSSCYGATGHTGRCILTQHDHSHTSTREVKHWKVFSPDNLSSRNQVSPVFDIVALSNHMIHFMWRTCTVPLFGKKVGTRWRKDFKQAEKTGYILFQIFTSLLVKINMSPVKVLYVKSCKGPGLSRYKSVTVNDTSDKLSPPLFACGFVSLCVLAGCHTETTCSHNYCLY